MNRKQDRTVYQREDGIWVNQLTAAPWSSSQHMNREDALRAARQSTLIHGGGELTLLAPDGTVEYQIEISPENE